MRLLEAIKQLVSLKNSIQLFGGNEEVKDAFTYFLDLVEKIGIDEIEQLMGEDK